MRVGRNQIFGCRRLQIFSLVYARLSVRLSVRLCWVVAIISHAPRLRREGLACRHAHTCCGDGRAYFLIVTTAKTCDSCRSQTCLACLCHSTQLEFASVFQHVVSAANEIADQRLWIDGFTGCNMHESIGF